MIWVAAAYAAYNLYSAEQGAAQMEEAARKKREQDERNARLIEEDAYNVEIYGESEIAAYDPQVSNVLAQQRLAMATADVDLSYGTAAEIQGETKLTGQLNKFTIRREAAQKAKGLRQEAQQVRQGAANRQTEANANANAVRNQSYAQAAETGLQLYSRYGK